MGMKTPISTFGIEVSATAVVDGSLVLVSGSSVPVFGVVSEGEGPDVRRLFGGCSVAIV